MSRSFSVGGTAVLHILSWFTLVRRACCAGGSGSSCQDLLRFDTSATRVRKGVWSTLGMTRAVSVRASVAGTDVVGDENRLGHSRCERLRDSLECLRGGRHCDNFGRTLRPACMASRKSFAEMPDVQGIFSVTMAHVCAQWASCVCRSLFGGGSRRGPPRISGVSWRECRVGFTRMKWRAGCCGAMRMFQFCVVGERRHSRSAAQRC